MLISYRVRFFSEEDVDALNLAAVSGLRQSSRNWVDLCEDVIHINFYTTYQTLSSMISILILVAPLTQT